MNRLQNGLSFTPHSSIELDFSTPKSYDEIHVTQVVKHKKYFIEGIVWNKLLYGFSVLGNPATNCIVISASCFLDLMVSMVYILCPRARITTSLYYKILLRDR